MRARVVEMLQDDEDRLYAAIVHNRVCTKLLLLDVKRWDSGMVSQLLGIYTYDEWGSGKNADIRLFPTLSRIARYDGANLHLNVSKMCRPALDWLDRFHLQDYENGYSKDS